MMKTENTIDLPYNENNTVISENDIYQIFLKYGLNIKPQNISDYRTALVHVSYCCRKNENFNNGNINCPQGCLQLQEFSNERHEFLGDSIISLITSYYLYNRFKHEGEGFLTKMRTKFVNGYMLSYLCEQTDIPKFIILSKQIDQNNGRNNKKILEDTFEAFVGAMFIDFSLMKLNALELCQKWLINIIEENVDIPELIIQNTNYKDNFLKYFQHTFNEIPKFYEISTEVTPLGKIYDVCIKDQNMTIISVGRGSNKKHAENNASYNALIYFGVQF